MPALPLPTRRLAAPPLGAIFLLLIGVALWAWADQFNLGPWQALITVPAALLLLRIPACRRLAAAAAESAPASLGHVSILPTLVTAVIATAYFACSAQLQGRDLGPHMHDHFMFLTQASQLAHGRLWTTIPTEIADSFDSPYLIVRPVYAAMCWPGTALAYVPGAWLQLPPWWTSVALAGAMVATVFHLARELSAPPAVATLTALFLAAGRPFHILSADVNAHVPLLLTASIAAVAAVRWTRGYHLRWAFLFGAAAGWAAICRPIDAICFLSPVVVATAIATVRRHARPMRALLTSAAVATVAAAPLLSIQLLFDHGVTGHWLEAPYTAYLHRDFPQAAYGFPTYDPAARPVSVVPQRAEFYRTFAVPFVIAHQPATWFREWLTQRLPITFRAGEPAPLLLALVPLGAVAWCRRRSGGAIAVAIVVLVCILYIPYTFFLGLYAVACAPALVGCVLTGTMAIANWSGPTTRAVTVAIAVGLTVACLPEVSGAIDDAARPTAVMAAREAAARIPAPARALILVTYHLGEEPGDEPVYNWSVPTPDDARITFAHDLDPGRNIALIHHYASAQPDRRVYRLNRADGSLHDLGNAADLARSATAP